MTRLLAKPVPFPGWVSGLVQDAEANATPLGSIVDGQNFVPLAAGRQQTRGGSRVMLTLHDDAGTPAEITQVPLIVPFTPVGAVAIGWSNGRDRHYIYRLTADVAFFTGTESTSRTDLSAAPSTTWNQATASARPVTAELFEKLFLADATTSQPSRNEFLSFTSGGVIARPTFVFAAGAASPLTPFCLEEYNGVLFLAGYGDEGDKDRPEILRHSFLAKSPDAADGFDKDAYLLLGAKGQRVTALRKGRGLLLAAKENEFYRITGFGRAYPGWQYQVESIQNTLGLGVSNPLALTFAEGFWYGVGAQGPFRTDGYLVESLVGPRQRGWRSIKMVDKAWVAYHPERHVVVFGLCPTLAFQLFGAIGQYPSVQWLWDLERSVWQTDWSFPSEIWMASAVTTTTAVGPASSPSAPNTTAATTSGYTANWTNGDATAETELWEKVGSDGTWTQVTVLAAAAVTYARTGRLSHQEYFWRVRHRKSGVTSEFTADTSAKTLMTAPVLSLVLTGNASTSILTLLSTCEGIVVLVLQRDGVDFHTFASVSKGAVFLPVARTGNTYRARAEDSGWTASPSAYSNSVVAS